MFVPKRATPRLSACPRHGIIPCCHARRGVGFDPFAGEKLSLGATHENDMGYDLTVDETLLQQMEEAALPHYPALEEAKSSGERVGIRAYTSDFSPFFLDKCQDWQVSMRLVV